MSDDLNKRLATLNALLELKEAVAQDDLKAAQDCRDKRLILALDLSSADRKRHDARFNKSSM
jgi:ABC-type siderophore export system fused ATPase/permease subunit